MAQGADLDLQQEMEWVLVEEGLTGIAWTLVGEDGDASIGVAGLQDNFSGSAFASDTRFHVGSVTKALLATGVLRVATEGRIDLDAPVLRYLPELFAGSAPEGFPDVTVRHLLDHTAGMNDANLWQMFSERADAEAPLVAAFPDPESQLRVRAQPGTRFSYSNQGYTLLGMVIESVVGVRYERYLDEHILAPLSMHNSTFSFTTQEGENADPKLAWGHVDDGSRYAASPIFLRPAGQFTSTAADLARFSAFLLGDGVINGRVFVDETLMRSRGKPSGTEAANEGLVAGYALGLARRDRHGVVAYCHGGNIVGFVAMLCMFPDENKAFAYSVNTDSETANYGRVESLLIRALDIPAALPPQTVGLSPQSARWNGRYVFSPNRFAMFSYLDTVFGAIKVFAGEASVSVTTLQQAPRELRPVGDRLYSSSNRTTASHVFFRGKNGEHLVSDGFQTYEKVSSAYLFAHWLSILAGLAGLIWLLIAGCFSLIRNRSEWLGRAEAPAFLASALLFVPIPVFFTQSFMALGDFTIASALLAFVSLSLPIGMFFTLIRAIKKWKASRIDQLHGIAAILVLQWCAVLLAAGMLPFRLWA